MKAIVNGGAVGAVLLLVSCGGGAPAPSPAEPPAPETPVAAVSSDPLDRIVLDRGKRWQMDEHTRTMFVRMSDAFLGLDIASLDEDRLRQAGSELQGHLDALVRGCTMQGPAHDQLHVYLTGYMPAVAALAETGSVDAAETVRRYLEAYDTYFE